MDNRSHKSSTSVYDNVFISNTSRYFIEHLIFRPLFFFPLPSHGSTRASRDSGRKFINPVNGGRKTKVEENRRRRIPYYDVVFRSFIGRGSRGQKGATFQYFHAIYVHARIVYSKPDKKSEIAFVLS